MPHQQFVSQLNEITEVLIKETRTNNLEHKFIVPGWIGFIQECIICHNKEKALKRPLYNGLGYLECANYIMDCVDNACKARVKSTPNFRKSNTDPENLEILTATVRAIDIWMSIYPEIAFDPTIPVSKNCVTTPCRKIQNVVYDSLSTIMDISEDKIVHPDKTKKRKNIYSISEINKNTLGNRMAGIICNLLLVTVIICIFDSLF